ncbi:MAG: ROK family protein [Spirochaetes bacterium]|nr:ROK family protein [Spirochaetota bacterium]
MQKYTIGVDVGGTKTAYGVFDTDKNLIRHLSHPSNTACPAEDFFDQIAANVNRLMAACEIQKEEFLGVGLGMPSFILYEEGYIVKTSNLKNIKNFPARSYLSQKLNFAPVVLDNDAKAAGLAEYRYGAGRGFDKMFFCPLSSGIASALFIDGKPFRGSYGWAGEGGHMIATPGQGIPCGCGNRGCYMSWCSGTMIVQHIKSWIAAGEKTVMAELAGTADKIDSIILEKAYDAGDPMAVKAMNQMIHWLGVWFYNLYVTLNVNCFVVGGGLVNMGEKLLKPVRDIFDNFNHDENPVYFKPAQCGENYGVLGAAELVSSALEEKSERQE